MFSALFIFIAALLNACMDKHQFHYYKSLFAHSANTFFAPDGWRNKYIDRDPSEGRIQIAGINVHPALLDIWHFCKSGMVIMLSLSVVFYEPIFEWYIDFVIYGLVWNITFSLFFNKILHYER